MVPVDPLKEDNREGGLLASSQETSCPDPPLLYHSHGLVLAAANNTFDCRRHQDRRGFDHGPFNERACGENEGGDPQSLSL